ncbi:MAG: alanine racemase [Capsulimonadaceae bacterium]
MPPTAWVSISPAALRHNVQKIVRHLATASPAPRLIAVVKANAYGHGAGQAAAVMEAAGVDFFAVTTAEEALELRVAGITGDILMFAPPLAGRGEELIERNISLTVADQGGLGWVADAARRVGRPAMVHLKVDSGMGRLGFLPSEAPAAVAQVAAGPATRLAGVYTHFSRALEPGFAPTIAQFQTFQKVLAAIEAAGIDISSRGVLRHCANSAAFLRDHATWLDAVRIGTLLYGQYPTPASPRSLDLQATWQLKARVVSVRSVPAQTAVGYGAEYITSRASRLAILPIGYAEGVTLAPSSVMSGWRGAKVLVRNALGAAGPAATIRGRPAPILGRVAMQMMTVDVTNIDGVEAGDIADVPCRRLAASARLPRVYEEG